MSQAAWLGHSWALGALFLFVLGGPGCASRESKGPTTPLPPVVLEKLPFRATPEAFAYTLRSDGAAVRAVFKGAADLGVEVTEFHLGPRQSMKSTATSAAVYEVREGQATVTSAGKTAAVGPGGVFVVDIGAAVQVSNTGDGPLALHVVSVRLP
jgi:mannose-6-phosphate isomerase-like protein (cupin superfamily)